MKLTEENGAVQGTARIEGTIAAITGTSPCTPLPADTFGLESAAVTGTPGSLVFNGNQSNNFGTGTPPGLNAYTYAFTGTLGNGQVDGTLRVTRTITSSAQTRGHLAPERSPTA